MLVGLSIALIAIAACGANASKTDKKETKKDPVVLSVSTMYAGEDSNAENFSSAAKAWEELSGNIVDDVASTADEAYKNRIVMEFQTGDEPDVLFYFNGVDSNTLVANSRVVSVEEIREVYPDYATNMKEGMMKTSPYDGKIYCIPVNGYWEGLFVNKSICKAAGVDAPDENTTWDEFLVMCEKIKEAGYVPVAASLFEVPHYWFEYCIFNHQSVDTHAIVPVTSNDRYAEAWKAGLNDIKEMYENGFFPDKTLSMSDAEAKKLFIDGKAAFHLEGSWNVSWLEKEAKNPEDFCVSFVPGNGSRKATDIISGLSTGYFITRKAWDNPEKRDAAVSFVQYMTSDEMVSKFAKVSATALTNGVSLDKSELSNVVVSALDMAEGATGVSEAVQDYVSVDDRAPIFENMPAIMRGEMSISNAVEAVISRAGRVD